MHFYDDLQQAGSTIIFQSTEETLLAQTLLHKKDWGGKETAWAHKERVATERENFHSDFFFTAFDRKPIQSNCNSAVFTPLQPLPMPTNGVNSTKISDW